LRRGGRAALPRRRASAAYVLLFFSYTFPVGVAAGIAGDQLIGGPVLAAKPRADPIIEVEPGE